MAGRRAAHHEPICASMRTNAARSSRSQGSRSVLRLPLGAFHPISPKSVRFSSVPDLFSPGTPDYGSDSGDSLEEADDGESQGAGPSRGFSRSIFGIGIRDRPPSPPPSRKNDSVLLDLTGQITRENNFALAHGSFADVWKGTWLKGSMRVKVVVKVLRSSTSNNSEQGRLNQCLRRELCVWRNLVHENVLPLLGTCSDFGPSSAIVCPWLQNGNLNKYLNSRDSALHVIDRFKILRGVAAGLLYLHSYSIVHGDLTGSNVLIDPTGQACLSDFGLFVIHAEFQGASFHSSSITSGIRWSAPELYCSPNSHDDNEGESRDLTDMPSEQSDVYSFGSIMLQTLSGRIPYYTIRRDPQVLIELSKRKYPSRPPTPFITNEYWDFINLCWSPRPMDRPIVEEVLEYIEDECDSQLSKIRPLRDLTGKIKRVGGEGRIPFEFVHVWEGIWLARNVTVDVKILRSQTNFEEGKKREVRRMRRDLRLWQELDHKNVVSIYGVVADFGPLIAMIMPHVGDINLTRYLNHLRDVLSPSTRFMLLYEISAGLCYLHSMSVIHGGLSGCSIFIKDGSACLTDFGLIPIMAEFQSGSFHTWCGDAIRWADPSIWLYNASSTSITKHSDIYAFGCITLQVLTSRIPFAEWPTTALIPLMKQSKLYHPPHPRQSPVYDDTGILEDAHWAFIQQCWAENPIDRPTVEEVSAHVQWFYAAPPTRNVREPEPVSPSQRRSRLLRRRSIIIEDEMPAGESVSTMYSSRPRPAQGRMLPLRPRSIVDDNESSDDEYSGVIMGMGNLRT